MLKLACIIAIVALVSGSPISTIEKAENEITCSICTHLITNIHDALTDKQHQSRITERLLSLCNNLNTEEKEECELIIHSAGDDAMGSMAEEMRPEEFCGMLGFCQAEPQQMKPVVKQPVRETPVEGSAGCELCEFVVQLIDGFVQQNSSEAAINATIYKVCNSLPDPIKSTCLGFAPELVKVLSAGFDPKEACTKIKLCDGFREPMMDSALCELCQSLVDMNVFGDVTHGFCFKLKTCHSVNKSVKQPHQQPADSPGCEICQFVVQILDSYLNENRTDAAVNSTLYKVCNSLPDPIKSTCLTFAPNLVKVLTEGFDPRRACTDIKLCQAGAVLKSKFEDCDLCRDSINLIAGPQESARICESANICPKQEKSNVQGPGCELCEFVVQLIDGFVQQNSSEAAINATIYKVCNSLPDPIKSTCLGFAPELVKVISAGFDPKEACTKIKLCDGKTKENIKDMLTCDGCKITAGILLGEEKVHICEKTEACKNKEDSIPVQTKDNIDVEGAAGCELCEFVVQLIDGFVQQNSSEAAINATIYKVCNSLPDPIKSTCMGFAPELVKVLSAGFDPKEACTKIKLCDGQTKQKIPVQTKDNIDVKGPGCELCEFVVQLIDGFVEKNSSEAAINATIYKVCNSLPDPIKSTCLGFAPELVKVLSAGFDPKEACTKIKLCDGQSQEKIPVVTKDDIDLKGAAGCELCEFVVQLIDGFVQQNSSEEAINATIYKVCNSLPDPIKSTCLGFAPELVKVLSAGFDPKEACTKIKLCDGQTKEKTPVQTKDDIDVKGPGCELCEFVVQLIDGFVEKNSSEAAINATIYKVCNSLPDPIKSTCLGFAPELVKVLSAGFDPKEACTKIKLCDGQTKEKTPVQTKDDIDVKGPGCELCEFVVQLIDGFVEKNSSAAAINATIYKVCNSLPDPIKSTCLGFAPELVKVISSGLDPKEACTKIKLCDGRTKINDVQKKVGNAGCEFCELLVKQVDQFLQSNTSVPAINATLDKICNSLPSTFKALCKSYAPSLAKALENGFDPVKACSDVRLCLDDSEKRENGWKYAACDVCHSEMKIIFPEDYKKWCLPACDVLKNDNTPVKVVSHVAEKAVRRVEEKGVGCELCKLIVQEVDTYLEQNRSEAAVNATLYKVCDSLPATFKTLCLGYIPTLEKALRNGLDPLQACTEIHVCTNSTMSRVVRSTEGFSFGEVKCDLCRDIMRSLDTDVFKDEATVKKDVDNICDRLPQPAKDQCRNEVDPNWKKFWNNLVNVVASPDHVCDLLTLCKKS
ncbi:hypothetical protein SNE40_005792 [Patella caerulea]|uniref:Saposin B-type domain-containing protein n=1 Tax=Patella caerulea TaxID=87958 RepID=A0AAN8Q0D9_PATCE